MENRDVYYMDLAVKEAVKALEADDVPVGCVIVHENKVIAKAHNQIKLLKDPTAHAEMLAITQATGHFGNERLSNCRLYVTIEPCSMCAGAMVLARIDHLIFAAKDPKSGACGSVLNVADNPKLNHQIKITSGILRQESAALLREFFAKKRIKKSGNAK
jgi:tRNA(adenine34) deaminase